MCFVFKPDVDRARDAVGQYVERCLVCTVSRCYPDAVDDTMDNPMSKCTERWQVTACSRSPDWQKLLKPFTKRNDTRGLIPAHILDELHRAA